MKRTTMACLAVMLAVLVASVAQANDEQIARQIVERLQQQQQTAKLEGFNIGVQVEQGTVTVMGTVSQTEHALTALDISRRVPGVKLVVNDLFVQPAVASSGQIAPASAIHPVTEATPAVSSSPAIPATGAGLAQASVPPGPMASTPQPTASTESIPPASAIAVAPASPFTPVSSRGTTPAQTPNTAAAAQPLAAMQRSAANQKPVAFAPSTRLAAVQHRAASPVAPEYQHAVPAQYHHPIAPSFDAASAGPTPVPTGVVGGGAVMQAGYDNPQMPGYAWPSYAAYPNYAALTYPHQYSPTAWPYIGPFYPYPQVPLGWRKVTLEWDDGWWFLDFKSKTKH